MLSGLKIPENQIEYLFDVTHNRKKEYILCMFNRDAFKNIYIFNYRYEEINYPSDIILSKEN